MKKMILILATVMFGLLLPQTAKSQLQLSQKLDYSNPPLKYYRITDNIRYTEIDFSKQKITTEEDGKYSVKLPFVVSKTAPVGELFWLLLYVPYNSKFSGWGIYTANHKFICKDFYTFRTADAKYHIQTQDNLNQKVTAGNYYLKLTFSVKPATKDIKISVAYSTLAVLNEFVTILDENQIPAAPQKPAETTVTRTSNGEVIIPNISK